jgi:cytochrome oxidase Cu insertion factor (SCO1/SenC/PrrC family)
MRSIKIAGMILFSLFIGGYTQTAKDFTVTDVAGKSHTLYTYLNAGKYVLLSFMFDG